jgi:hypothetical protein
MRLDIRLPLGLLFLVLGSLLLIFGLVSDKDLYERSLGIDINLWWGVVMSLFALILLGLAYRSHLRARQSPDGGNAPSERE